MADFDNSAWVENNLTADFNDLATALAATAERCSLYQVGL